MDSLIFSGIVFAGMLLQSLVGFAGALFSIPLLTLFFEPRSAVPAFQLIVVLVNTYLVIQARKHVAWRRMAFLVFGALAGIPIGAYGLKHLPVRAIGSVVGAVTLCFAVLTLARVNIRMKERATGEIGIGFLSGLLGGMVSQPGPPIVVYGIARGWGKESFRGTLLAFFFAVSFSSVASYAVLGMYTRANLLTTAIAVAPAFGASYIGVILKARIDERLFRKLVLAVITMVGATGLVRSIVAP